MSRARKKVRLAFFADPHIQDEKERVQTDIGRPSAIISQQAKKVLNQLKPDYIFGLGDLTANGMRAGWRGYKNWVDDLEAPVFDLLGNHDRDYSIFTQGNYGAEYFTELGRMADTQVLRLGNVVLILVSEEHHPEGSKIFLNSTIPDKRLAFIEKFLKKYSENSHVFVLSHTPVYGTTALSDAWAFNDSPDWIWVSKKLLCLFRQYPVVAHITGHIHMDYRQRTHVQSLRGIKSNEKIGKLINWPEVHFLNMPCVDLAHGWFSSRCPLIRELAKSLCKVYRLPWRKFYFQYESQGPVIVDFFYQLKGSFLGRSAVYYFDLEHKGKEIKIITRWLEGNIDAETYCLPLKHPLRLGSGKISFLGSDLSLQDKKGLVITKNDWFKIPAGKKGKGVFSQKYSRSVQPRGLAIKARNLKNYSVFWKGSKSGDFIWSRGWSRQPSSLGAVRAVLVRIDFHADEQGDSRVKDIQITTKV